MLDILTIISIILPYSLSYKKIYLFHFLILLRLNKILQVLNLLLKNKENKILILFYLYNIFQLLIYKNKQEIFKSCIYITCGILICLFTQYVLIKKKKKTYKIAKLLYFFMIIITLFEISLKKNIVSNIFFKNINNFSVILAMIFPAILFYTKNIKKFIYTLIIVWITFKYDAKATLIGIFIEIYLYYSLFTSNKKIKRTVILIIFIIIFFIFQEKILKIFQEIFIVSTNNGDSIGIRKQLINNIIEELKRLEVLFFGVGSGNSTLIHKVKNNTFGIERTHNFMLDLLVENGLFIFIMISLMYINFLRKFYIRYRKNKKNSIFFITIVGFFIALNGVSTVIYFFPVWMLLGVLIYNSNIKNYDNLQNQERWRQKYEKKGIIHF